MPDQTFFVVLETTVGANSSATLSYQVPTSESHQFLAIKAKSTGDFNVTDIRDSQGKPYTNASTTVEIPGDFFQNVANGYNAYTEFPVPIAVPGGAILYIDVEDVSGSNNTITFVLIGIRTTRS